MDEDIIGLAKFDYFMSTLFGTFDFDEVAASSQVEKEKRVRRKAEPVAEKRPTTLSATDAAGKAEGGRQKVDIVYSTIKEV